MASSSVALSPAAQQTLMALMQTLGSTMAGLDTQESQDRLKYAGQLDAGTQARAKSLLAARQNMTDHGLGQSGIALGNQVDVNKTYDAQNGQYAQALDSDLTSIARKRLQAQADYNLQQAQLQQQSTAQQNPASYQPPAIPAKTPSTALNSQTPKQPNPTVQTKLGGITHKITIALPSVDKPTRQPKQGAF